jgi:hypothetical protein
MSIKAQVGDVLLIPYFPHQEDREGEPRWIIVIEDLESHYEIVPFSKQMHQISRYKKTITILHNSIEGQEMGLTSDSIIICDRNKQVPKSSLDRPPCKKKGNCPQSTLDEILELISSTD